MRALLDALAQRREGSGELLHALLLEGVDDIVVVDSCLLELVEKSPRLVDALGERIRDDAVILEGAQWSRRASC